MFVTPAYEVELILEDEIEATMFLDTMSGTESAAGIMWEELEAAGPPARQAHAAVVYDGCMFVHGGERSAYEYSDIWKFDPAVKEWSFVSPKNDTAPARHDHSAVVYDGVMYIYGGRGPVPLGDFWMYTFATGEWMEMPSSEGMSARFGHTAVVVDGVMLVYGGYVAEEGGLTDELWQYEFETEEWTLLGPRTSNFDEYGATPYVADPADAIQFPSDIPEARFSHVAVATGHGMIIFGGAGGATMKSPLADMWYFNLPDKTWSPVTLGSYDGLARYDSAAAMMSGPYMVTFGGHGSYGFLADAQFCFAGLEGLGASEAP